ncbi:MAG: lysophospholipid acyltransferase family protein [Bdellovibrionales bacterium]
MTLWLRSLALNITLYGWTAFLCFALLVTLVLPRKAMTAVVRLWLSHLDWIEKHIGGIHYRVIGREHIPPGACIIAAKHQSAWETFKLHLLLGDPAIVLKAELLNIPIWGWYVRRAGMIPIDRARGAQALSRMMKAAHKAADEGRKIVIFPQGTRIAPGADRPYKSGVAALYEELDLPVVPMALNSGLLWGRNSFIKKPGLITVEFLSPIPSGLPRAQMMERLRSELEGATAKLLQSP